VWLVLTARELHLPEEVASRIEKYRVQTGWYDETPAEYWCERGSQTRDMVYSLDKTVKISGVGKGRTTHLEAIDNLEDSRYGKESQ
jgi:hypothetical protein